MIRELEVETGTARDDTSSQRFSMTHVVMQR
jgi:hypothetical protein